MGDDSWKKQPKIMSRKTLEKTTNRLKEHAVFHKIDRYSISFHGGEPLLAGAQYFADAAEIVRNGLGPAIDVDFGIQSNGLLLDENLVQTLDKHRISLAISMDGPQSVNDARRVKIDGTGSFEQLENRMRVLNSTAGKRIFAGVLAVININSDPLEVFDYIASVEPPTVDFLLPHGHWDRLPEGKNSAESTIYADYLIELFDAWWNGRHTHIAIRTFEEIIEHYLGGPGTLEVLGLAPVKLIVIAADGSYEAVDTMKSVEPGAHELGLNIFDHEMNEVLDTAHVKSRQNKFETLSSTCKNCELVRSCGGGYYPHRYDKIRKFNNPSIYCADYKKLIPHIFAAVRNRLSDSTKSTARLGSDHSILSLVT